MASQSDTESAIPFAKAATNEHSRQKANDVADANSRQAVETGETLSKQLHAAEDRIAALEGEVEVWREKLERAARWMVKIFKDIEERLLREPEERQRRLPRL